MRSLVIFLVLLAFSGAARAGDAGDTGDWPAYAAAERLGLAVCERDRIEEPLLCGTLTAPADRRDPDGASIDIAFVVIPARNGNPERIAWTEHGGGPGRVMLPVAQVFAAGGPLEHFRERRDVLLLDQRGMGESGGLYCEALTTPRVMERYYSTETVRACREEMREAGKLNADYSTSAAVDDLEAVRARLGFEQFDVGAWSYGTKFMLTYAQRYPERVRTLSLFVPTPVDYRRPVDWARFTQAAMEGMFDDCAAQAACAEAFPDLRGDWARLREKAEKDPPMLDFINPYTGMAQSRPMTTAILTDAVHVALIKVSTLRALPALIHKASQGDYGPFLALSVPEDDRFRPVAEATYLSIVCREETAFIEEDEAERRAEDSFVGLHFVDEFTSACDAWGASPHPDYPIEPARSDIPALIVAGGRDPITPIEYGERIARNFTNATMIPIEAMPHDTAGLPGALACLDRILFDFIEAGDMTGLDIACAGALTSAPFATP